MKEKRYSSDAPTYVPHNRMFYTPLHTTPVNQVGLAPPNYITTHTPVNPVPPYVVSPPGMSYTHEEAPPISFHNGTISPITPSGHTAMHIMENAPNSPAHTTFTFSLTPIDKRTISPSQIHNRVHDEYSHLVKY